MDPIDSEHSMKCGLAVNYQKEAARKPHSKQCKVNKLAHMLLKQETSL